jgi:PPIC-type PPIASE domain/SurA N-terminal domain
MTGYDAPTRKHLARAQVTVNFRGLERSMINVFRKHQKWLMIVIAILAMPFCLYFVRTDWISALRGEPGTKKLYGQTIPRLELDRGQRLFDLARMLGMSDFLNDILAQWRPQHAKTQSEAEREAGEELAIDLIILRHEANALGIRPTTGEIASVVSKMRAFRGDAGGFDPKKYNDIVENALGPRGFSEAQIEELAADQIRLERVKELIGTGTIVSPSESKRNFDQVYSKFEVSVVRFKTSDFANEVKISDDEVAKYYEGAKEQLKSEERRKVQFVAITLSEQEKKLTGKERVDALQKLSDKANDVVQALAEKGTDFGAVASKFQLPVKTTGEFTQDAPDPQLKQDPQLSQSAFQLSNEESTSEPIQVPDGFYILHLAAITPAKPMTLEEAKPKIIESLKARKERESATIRAANVAHDLGEALKAGDPIPKAAEKVKAKLEKLPPFTLADELEPKSSPVPEQSPDLPRIKNAVADLHPNEVTDPLPTADGAVVAVVEKRDPPDSAQAARNRASLEERILRGKREIIFSEWLRERRQAAGIQPVAPS